MVKDECVKISNLDVLLQAADSVFERDWGSKKEFRAVNTGAMNTSYVLSKVSAMALASSSVYNYTNP